jgi:tRNA(Ile)-lysidine synthase
MIWAGESELLLPNETKLIFKKVKGRGIGVDFLKDKKLIISNRRGGEFFKPDAHRPTKKIKQLFQESDLPPWEREKIPLIFLGQDLAYLPRFGVENKYQARSGAMGIEVTWKA